MTKAEEIQKKIERYEDLKRIEKEAKEERFKIESELMTSSTRIDGVDVYEGTEKVLEVRYGSTAVVDNEIAASLTAKYDKYPFRIKYELDKKLYDAIEKLSPEAHAEFSKAITFNPKKPTFNVKEKK
jgi:hypothetical protein